ncbi:MAG: succinate dehydrogenase/fumarate reductase iron-sulfur subunit [Epsilonproteobacteria bacterium]|nr:succinate dehydrogenase/fumarate reductase iron-sulfur subunit [Campylobacterota bacterium]
MRFRIRRTLEEKSQIVEYEIPLENPTLLEALNYLKLKVDRSLTFSSGCRSEICGSCAVRVNGKEKLACGYKLQENDLIEPLRYGEVIRDLVVDMNGALDTLKRSKAYLDSFKEATITYEDEKRIEIQTDCILCVSCFSSCPVLEVNGEFLGPFALTRVYRYVNDKREANVKDKIDVIQKNGIWDCTLCGECTMACPQGIDPKNDILMLRGKSSEFGYSDPSFSQGFGGFDDFGFNPSGF